MTDQLDRKRWGGKRPNSGRKRRHTTFRTGEVWHMVQPVIIGSEMVQSETLKNVMTLTVENCSHDEITLTTGGWAKVVLKRGGNGDKA